MDRNEKEVTPADRSEIEEFLQRMREEFSYTRIKYPKAISSPHEAAAIIREEFEEFWEEVRDNRSKDYMYRELVQIATMALRTVLDLDLEG